MKKKLLQLVLGHAFYTSHLSGTTDFNIFPSLTIDDF